MNSLFSDKSRNEIWSIFVRDAQRDEAHFEKSTPVYCRYTESGSKETCESRTKLQKRVFDENREQEHPTLQGCKHFQKGELKKEGRHIHFTRGLASQMLTVELIGSAKDICTLHGMCAHYGENQEDRKSGQGAASIVLTPGVFGICKLFQSICERYFIMLCLASGGKPLSKGINNRR